MIRPARAQDAPALAALFNHWIQNTTVTFNPVPKTKADILAMIADKAAADHAFLVAEEGGRIIGHAAHELKRRGGGVAVAAICIGVGQGLAVVLER